jgi:phosphate-selective porin
MNWYLNPYCKVVFNYIRAMPNNPVYGRSNTDIFGFRTQLDF